MTGARNTVGRYQNVMIVKISYPEIFSRPFRKPSSMTKAIFETVAPVFSISLAAALIVPPVASRSSMRKTRSPFPPLLTSFL